MRRECTENHLATLRRRYGEKRLCEAAVRREHLNYQRLAIGDSPGSGRVKSLLAQMHQTYYFGFSESACILAGTLLEQGLIYRLGAALDEQGPAAVHHGGEKRWLQTRSDLLELELVDMLELARAQGIITDGRTLLLAHEITVDPQHGGAREDPGVPGPGREAPRDDGDKEPAGAGTLRAHPPGKRRGGGHLPTGRRAGRRAETDRVLLREPHPDGIAAVVQSRGHGGEKKR